jgi:Calx-beta domain
MPRTPHGGRAEQRGAVMVAVTRTVGSAGAFTVSYATSDGTARAGEDYTATSGTLSFAAGETEKTFNVPVTNDSLDEDAESFSVTLGAPAGGVITYDFVLP